MPLPRDALVRAFGFGTPESFEFAQQLAAEGRPGVLALSGPVRMLHGDEEVRLEG